MTKRIDVTRSLIQAGQLVLKAGFPDIPSTWRDKRREAMGSNLTCVGMYFREGKSVKEIAGHFDVSICWVSLRIRTGFKFLKDYGWIESAYKPGRRKTGGGDPTGQSPRGS